MPTLILITMIVQWIIFGAIAVLSYWLVREIKKMEQEYVRWSDIGDSDSLMDNRERRNKEVKKGEIK